MGYDAAVFRDDQDRVVKANDLLQQVVLIKLPSEPHADGESANAPVPPTFLDRNVRRP